MRTVITLTNKESSGTHKISWPPLLRALRNLTFFLKDKCKCDKAHLGRRHDVAKHQRRDSIPYNTSHLYSSAQETITKKHVVLTQQKCIFLQLWRLEVPDQWDSQFFGEASLPVLLTAAFFLCAHGGRGRERRREREHGSRRE